MAKGFNTPYNYVAIFYSFCECLEFFSYTHLVLPIQPNQLLNRPALDIMGLLAVQLLPIKLDDSAVRLAVVANARLAETNCDELLMEVWERFMRAVWSKIN